MSLEQVTLSARMIIYFLLGAFAIYNSRTNIGMMQVYRSSVGLFCLALSASTFLKLFYPNAIDWVLSLILTPLVLWLCIMELIFFINHQRNHRPHRRMDD